MPTGMWKGKTWTRLRQHLNSEGVDRKKNNNKQTWTHSHRHKPGSRLNQWEKKGDRDWGRQSCFEGKQSLNPFYSWMTQTDPWPPIPERVCVCVKPLLFFISLGCVSCSPLHCFATSDQLLEGVVVMVVVVHAHSGRSAFVFLLICVFESVHGCGCKPSNKWCFHHT